MAALERPRLVDQVLDSLLNLIQDRGLEPGSALPRERELAIELGVSRSLVRQAFRILEDRGIVDSRQGSGRYLREADPGESGLPDALEVASIVDILETRLILERNAVTLACERRTAAEARQIQDRAGVLNAWQDNTAFHVAMADATHNFMLERLVRQQIDLSDQLRQRDRYDDPDVVELMRSEHIAIAEAIMNRDPETAGTLVAAHLQQTSKVVLASHRPPAPGKPESL